MARKRKTTPEEAQAMKEAAQQAAQAIMQAVPQKPLKEMQEAAQRAVMRSVTPETLQGMQQAAEDAIQSEAQRLLNLSFNEIQLLPDDKQQLVYQEIGRQLASSPEILTGLETLAKLSEGITDKWIKAAQVLSKPLEFDFSKLQKFFASIPQIKLPPELADRVKLFREVYPILRPYIDAEIEEHPEEYKNKDLRELMAAAARRARAEGKEIPPLWMEEPQPEDGEQLQMQLDLPEPTKEKPEEDTPAALIEALKKMPALIPQAHVMPNNALMNVMQQSGLINAGEWNVPVIPAKGRQKEITAFTIIDYSPGESGITITDPKITEHERQISDAIISLWVEAERQEVEPVFTIDAVYRAMPGGGDKASPQQEAAIAAAIEKFRKTHMTVDATEELRRRKVIDETETVTFDEYYFQIRRAKRTSKHSKQSVVAYQITSKPVILKYAEMTHQILTVPPKFLTVSKVKGGLITNEVITMNADRQAITGYMLRRISIMKHDKEEARERLKQYRRQQQKNPEMENKPLEAFKKQSSTILFDTMFSQAGIKTTDRKQLMLYRNFCYDVLQYWQATGFIKGYAEQNKGKKITGIDIEI